MTQTQLTKTILNSVPEAYVSLIQEAIDYAAVIHQGQQRLSGEPVLMHLLNVAKYVAELNLDVDSIIVAILHQVFRDFDRQKYSDVTEVVNEVREKFGEDVVTMLTTIENISRITKADSESAAITKYVLRDAQDLRILLIRLCDKLYNAQTIEALPVESREKFAKKLINIYAPIAEYLNLNNFKKQYETTAMQVLYPDDYIKVKQFLKTENLDEKTVKLTKDRIENVLHEWGYEALVWGRVKGPYSIFKKIRKYEEEGRKSEINSFKDLMAFSIVMKNVEQCYEVASLLQSETKSELRDYEDYIMHPKPNGFSQVQMCLLIPDISKVVIEIQIMTYEMYIRNNYGEASHFAYKIQGKRFAIASSEFDWVKDVHDKIKANIDGVKKIGRSHPILSNLFTERLFVFTPKEKIVELPLGATPIDFAFKVHTKLGSRMIGAKINGIGQDILLPLNNGDIVDIIETSNKSVKSTVKPEWLGFAKTNTARREIEKRLKKW